MGTDTGTGKVTGRERVRERERGQTKPAGAGGGETSATTDAARREFRIRGVVRDSFLENRERLIHDKCERGRGRVRTSHAGVLAWFRSASLYDTSTPRVRRPGPVDMAAARTASCARGDQFRRKA